MQRELRGWAGVLTQSNVIGKDYFRVQCGYCTVRGVAYMSRQRVRKRFKEDGGRHGSVRDVRCGAVRVSESRDGRSASGGQDKRERISYTENGQGVHRDGGRREYCESTGPHPTVYEQGGNEVCEGQRSTAARGSPPIGATAFARCHQPPSAVRASSNKAPASVSELRGPGDQHRLIPSRGRGCGRWGVRPPHCPVR